MDAPADNPDLDALLARFPGPLAIYPDKSILGGLLGTAIVGVIVSLWWLHEGFLLREFLAFIWGIFCGPPSVFATVRFARLLVSRKPLLTLDCDGFTTTLAMPAWNVPWSDVQDIQVTETCFSKQAIIN